MATDLLPWQRITRAGSEMSGHAAEEERSSEEDISGIKPPQQQIFHTPEAVEDFLRNFLLKAGLNRTLSCFEAEWYGSAPDTFIPDALAHRHVLLVQLDSVRRDTQLLGKEVMAAAESLVRTQRERDFHRLQHGRVAEQKHRLLGDYKQLGKHLQGCERALRQLEDKYHIALRHKTLLSLQKDRLRMSSSKNQSGRLVDMLVEPPQPQRK